MNPAGLRSACCFLSLLALTVPLAAQGPPEVVWSHTGQSNQRLVQYSADGLTIVTCTHIPSGPDGWIKVWRASDRVLLGHFRAGHSGPVYSMALSPDGQTVATASGDRTVRLTRTSDGSLVRALTHTDEALSVAFSSDGLYVAAGGKGSPSLVTVWRISDGALVWTLDGHTTEIRGLAFSPDGQLLASGAPWPDSTVRLWRLSDGALINTLSNPGDVGSLAFSPDGQTLVVALDNLAPKVWRVSDGVLLRELIGHARGAHAVAFASSSSVVYTGGWDETIKRWDLTDGSCTLTIPTSAGGIYTISLPTDGLHVVAGHKACADVWNTLDGGLAGMLGTGHGGGPGVGFSPDGTEMLTWSYDGELRVSRVSDGCTLLNIPYSGNALWVAAFTPDGTAIVTGDGSSMLRLWDASTGALKKELNAGHDGYVAALAFSPDGTKAATVGDGGKTQIWRVSDWTLVRSIPSPGAASDSVAWSPDGTALAVGYHYNLPEVRLWRVSDGVLLRTIPLGFEGSVWAVTFAPDGQTLVSAASRDANHACQHWRVSDGALLHTLPDTVAPIAFTPDGAYLIGAGTGYRLLFWGTDNWTVQRYWDAGMGPGVCGLAPSADGQYLGLGTGDGTYMLARMPGSSTPTALSVASVAGCAGSNVLLAATLMEAGNSEPIAGESVAFAVEGTGVGSGTTNASGLATCAYSIPEALGAGDKRIDGSFAGDSGFGPSDGTGTLAVSKAGTTLWTAGRTGSITEAVSLRQYDLKRTTDDALLPGRTIVFRIDGTMVGTATTDSGGDSVFTWTITEGPAARTITTAFEGDGAYNPSSGTATLTCQSWGTKMVAFDRTARITDRTELKCRLLRSDNAPLYGKPINFYIDGTFIITRTTNVDGYASYPNYDVPDGAGSGARTILSEWPGNGGYAGISKTATLTVLKAIPYIWVLSKSVPQGGVANLYAYFRRLYDYQKQTGKTVDLKIDGTVIQTVITDDVGVARYLYRTVETPGVHTIRCEFYGDAIVEPGYGEGNLTVY